MESFFTQSNVMFVIGILGILFTVYNYFREPQIETDTTTALMSQQLKDLQLQLTNLRDNHLHSLDIKVDATNQTVANMAVEIAKLGTIIEERIPKRE